MVAPAKSSYPMLSVAEGLQHVMEAVKKRGPATTDTVAIQSAFGRTLAEDVTAPFPHPAFPASIVDGYALHLGGSGSAYSVVSESFAGAEGIVTLKPGEASYITTGAKVPDGASAMVPVEQCNVDKQTVTILTCDVSAGQNIRPVGSDIPQGTVVLNKGLKMGSAEIGVCCTVGKASVLVYRPPRIAILSTGNEVVSIGNQASLRSGQIFDSNGPMLKAQVEGDGAVVTELTHLNDDKGVIGEYFRKQQESDVDIIITTGGVSMGRSDYVKPLLEEMGQVIFGRLNLKPGKPTTYGHLPSKGRPESPIQVFALPGNPVSVWVTYHLFVVPVMRAMQGVDVGAVGWPCVDVEVQQDLQLDKERPEYHRCVVYAEDTAPSWGRRKLKAISTGHQISSRLLSSVGANGLLQLPAQKDTKGSKIPRGSTISALLIGAIASVPPPMEVPPVPSGPVCKCGMVHEEGTPHAHQTNGTKPKPTAAVHPSLVHAASAGAPMPKDGAGYSAAVLVCSDRCSRGEAEDRSGPVAVEYLSEHAGFPLTVHELAIVPDEIDAIRTQVNKWVSEGMQLIVTSGGTGFAPRDRTPEALEPLFDRRCHGLTHQMMDASLQATPTAGLSRLTAGIIKLTLVLALPGSPKAVSE
uniref:molybdopterin adenylyltransferase n=1 Tax=Vitrella brassicaformis TaxID=1169539 RepID=A0A7S1JNB8_9ALVE